MPSLRDNFPEPVKRKLEGRVSSKCSNPDCRASTKGPAAKGDATVNVGVAAHITAAARKGPRYDEKLTEKQRRSFRNGIWLCQTCGTAVDADESAHTVVQLRSWKRWAEAEARGALGVTRSNSHFELLPGDQTLYINLRRFDELAQRNHVHTTYYPMKPNTRLLDLEGNLVSFVADRERALKSLFPLALPIDSLKTNSGRHAAIGQLIHFVGRFRSKNSPRLRGEDVPITHPIGDISKDHHAYAEVGSIRLVLPLDSLWFASHSSVGFFRSTSRIHVRGLARVHLVTDSVVVASPVWLALPAKPTGPSLE